MSQLRDDHWRGTTNWRGGGSRGSAGAGGDGTGESSRGRGKPSRGHNRTLSNNPRFKNQQAGGGEDVIMDVDAGDSGGGGGRGRGRGGRGRRGRGGGIGGRGTRGGGMGGRNASDEDVSMGGASETNNVTSVNGAGGGGGGDKPERGRSMKNKSWRRDPGVSTATGTPHPTASNSTGSAFPLKGGQGLALPAASAFGFSSGMTSAFGVVPASSESTTTTAFFPSPSVSAFTGNLPSTTTTGPAVPHWVAASSSPALASAFANGFIDDTGGAISSSSEDGGDETEEWDNDSEEMGKTQQQQIKGKGKEKARVIIDDGRDVDNDEADLDYDPDTEEDVGRLSVVPSNLKGKEKQEVGIKGRGGGGKEATNVPLKKGTREGAAAATLLQRQIQASAFGGRGIKGSMLKGEDKAKGKFQDSSIVSEPKERKLPPPTPQPTTTSKPLTTTSSTSRATSPRPTTAGFGGKQTTNTAGILGTMMSTPEDIAARRARFNNSEGTGNSKIRRDDSKGKAMVDLGKNRPNRYMALKGQRDALRRSYVSRGLIPDPSKRVALDDAIDIKGECEEMCPEFEREEREYQQAADLTWECYPGTNKIDPKKAVKTFHRPAAGDETPLPSDIRPPHVLQQTLDYLFHDVLGQDPTLYKSHNFIGDRTRAVRQDFVHLRDTSPIAVECHERIVRYHILAVHVLRGKESHSAFNELEQLRKTLQSLMQFYEDARAEGRETSPNEAEFRSYALLAHLRNHHSIRSIESLPVEVFDHPLIQTATRLHALAQKNNETKEERGRRPANSEASLNGFTRFFKAIAASNENAKPRGNAPGYVPFLMACMLEINFPDIRRGALKAMRSAYSQSHNPLPIEDAVKHLGADDEQDCIEICEAFGVELVREGGSVWDGTEGVQQRVVAITINRAHAFNESATIPITRPSKIIQSKRSKYTNQDLIDFGGSTQRSLASRVPSVSTRVSSPGHDVSRDVSASIVKAQPQRKPSLKSTIPLTADTVGHPTPATLGSTSGPQTLKIKLQGLRAEAPTFNPNKGFGVPPSPAATPSFSSPVRRSSIDKPIVSSPGVLRTALPPIQEKAFPSSSTKAPSRRTSTLLSQAQLRDKRMVDALATSCATELIGTVLEGLVERAAEDALEELHEEREEIERWQRDQIIEGATLTLTNVILEDLMSQEVGRIAVETKSEQMMLQNYFVKWKDQLATLREARERRKARLAQFGRDVKTMGVRFVGPGSSESPSPARKRSREVDEIMAVGDISIEPSNKHRAIFRDTVDESMGDLLQKAKSRRVQMWTRSTFLQSTVSRIDPLLATRSSTRPRWKILLVTRSLSSAIAAWLRCKFDISNDSNERQFSAQNADFEIELCDHESLAFLSSKGRRKLGGVGMVILDCTPDGDEEFTSHPWRSQVSSELHNVATVLRRSTRYSPKLFVLSCTPELEADDYQKEQLIKGALQRQLRDPLWSHTIIRQLNLTAAEASFDIDLATITSVVVRDEMIPVPGSDVCPAFFQAWHWTVGRAVDLISSVSDVEEMSRMCVIASVSMVSALETLAQSVYSLDEDSRMPKLLPPFHPVSSSLGDNLKAYLRDPIFFDVDLSRLEADLEAGAGDVQLMESFLDAMATFVSTRLDNHQFQHGNLAKFLPGVLSQFEFFLQEETSALDFEWNLARSRMDKAVVKRKRQSSSSFHAGETPAKRIAEESVVGGSPMSIRNHSPPSRLTSLKDLISETKLMLNSAVLTL